ncbi:hypothetical protein FNH05_16005 [Amycolatopsis rhizosphaerae]|uniref:Uncharacterized protein n=1 Tax=Amycolatopsis rhizosphaerae TaxID=2053003 RepID=A0A558CNV7_9PSEU|nr:hypothetical protein [Amycolatopsis rhizosphaerae]TVT50443.1 hypothetical protein FNH05_16005 [Amycolatopsis rhizosphaerae]
MSKVTVADLRKLLEAGDGASLVLEGGRILLVPPEQLPGHAGAMTVTTREDLRQRLGTGEPEERTLREQAEILNTGIAELGA